jgi:hypothetical protein
MGIFLLGIWLILYGLTLAAVISLSGTILGVFAVVVGVVLLFEGRGVITNVRR